MRAWRWGHATFTKLKHFPSRLSLLRIFIIVAELYQILSQPLHETPHRCFFLWPINVQSVLDSNHSGNPTWSRWLLSKGKLDLFGYLGLLSTFADYLLRLIALTRLVICLLELSGSRVRSWAASPGFRFLEPLVTGECMVC